PRLDCQVHGVAGSLAQSGPNGFQHTQNIAYASVIIFQAHVDDAAVVGNAVKGGVYLDAAPAELIPDIPWEDHVGTVLLRQYVDDRVIFIPFARRRLFPPF